jgi:uncharacterized protein (TIGR03792 family)
VNLFHALVSPAPEPSSGVPDGSKLKTFCSLFPFSSNEFNFVQILIEYCLVGRKITMVIEWLQFRVESESREKFIAKDNEVWTATLANYPGFIGKEIWLDPTALDRLTLVIRWQTRQQWKSVPQEILEETERKFALAMGETSYEMIDTKEYQIRKFPEVAR